MFTDLFYVAIGVMIGQECQLPRLRPIVTRFVFTYIVPYTESEPERELESKASSERELDNLREREHSITDNEFKSLFDFYRK